MADLLEKPLKVAEGHFLLRFRMEGSVPEPGQFINIRVGEGTDPLLRRPFSIFDWNDGIAEAVIRVVGRGTFLLSGKNPGTADITGPAGRGFSPVSGGNVLLVGGGVGNAPLLYLAKKLRASGNKVIYVYGARTRTHIFCEDRYRAHADRLVIATDDGSQGMRGTAGEAAKKAIDLQKIDAVYSCGPVAMMKDVAGIARGIPVEISVENYFGCGMGLCYGCSVETTGGMKRGCVDGPVFDGKKIIWDSLPQSGKTALVWP